MKKRGSFALFVLCLPVVPVAQPFVKQYNVLWAAYHVTHPLHNKWNLVIDAQVRTKNWADQWLLYAIRSGITYKGAHNFAFSSGLALFRNSQYNNKDVFFKNEWRPWEEAAHSLKITNHLNLLQRVRLEERFLQRATAEKPINHYDFVFRLRYKFEWQYALPIKNITVSAANEIFVDPGYLNKTCFFDQNRTFAGFNVKLNSNTTLQNQFIKIYQWHGNSHTLDDQNVIRVTFIQQFNKITKGA